MNKILHKTFLDSLLDSTQQNPFAKSFAFDWARSAGAFLNIKGNVDNGTELDGTALDDEIIIGGNLIGGNGSKDATSINLFDGNDTLTVKGKVIVDEGQYVSITGGDGNNTVNLNGGIDTTTVPTQQYGNSSITISLYGSATNTINVTGDIVSQGNLDLNLSGYSSTNKNIINVNGSIISKNEGVSVYDMDGLTNTFIVQNDIILQQNSRIDFYLNGVDNTFKINGDFIFDNSDAFLCLTGTQPEDSHDYATVEIAGLTKITDSSFLWMLDQEDYATITFNDISITNGSLDVEVGDGISSNLIVNGNIEVQQGSFHFSFPAMDTASMEIDGQIILQGETANWQNSAKIDSSDSDFNLVILGGVSNDSAHLLVESWGGNDTIYVGHSITASDTRNITASNEFSMDSGDDTFTLVGNMSATANGKNLIDTGEGNDTIKITGDISASNGGSNSIFAGEGDDFIYLNGRIGAGALSIDAGDGNDTLVLTAVTQRLFETDYKEWLTDLSASGALAKSGLETIRVDVNFIQQNKLGWLTDIVNKTNADGAHITLEDKAGHQLVNPSTYLAQNNDTHNPINDVLDHYAPATTNAAQPKTFAENVAAPSTDAFAAPHFDNNSFLHEMEQQAQVHAAAAA